MHRMHPSRRSPTQFRSSLLLVLIALATPAAAQQPLPDDCLPSSRVKPGMEAFGMTVFQGFEVERFEVEILGVEHGAFAKGNMILVRLGGHEYLERHGVVAGMSGSPVYVIDPEDKRPKMIGAVAYGWSFAYHPYGGVTPIEDMWAVWNSIGKPELQEKTRRGEMDGDSGHAWDWQSAWERYRQRFDGDGGADLATARFRPSHPALAGLEGEMVPLMTPLFVSGGSPRTTAELRRFFGSYGLQVLGGGTLAGGSTGGGAQPSPALQDGSALGVPYLTGDLGLAGVGTVTYTRGDKVIAFGHPMDARGGTETPMAHARVFGFMQSYMRSFKLSEIRETIGTIDQDRQPAIGGRIGPSPATIPIRVRIGGSGAARPRAYEYTAWEEPAYLPALARIALGEAYFASASEGGEYTAELDYTIRLADGRTIRKKLLNASQGYVLGYLTMSLTQDLFNLLDNPFAEADLSGIDAQVTVTGGAGEELLSSAELDYGYYLAGDEMGLTLRLLRWRESEYTRRLQLKLPGGLEPGPYVVHVADAAGAQRLDMANRPSLYAPRDFTDVFEMTAAMDFPENRLRIYLVRPSMHLELGGVRFANLPGSVEAIVRTTAPSDIQRSAIGDILLSRTLEFGAPVLGTQSVSFEIVDKMNQ